MALYLGSSGKKKLKSGLYQLIYKITNNLQFAKVGDVINSDITLTASWTKVEQNDPTMITGDSNGLQYTFDQNRLQLDITDTGLAGDSFSLVGDTITINNPLIIDTEFSATYDDYTESYRVVRPDVDSTIDHMVKLCNEKAVIDVVFDGKTYKCKAKYFSSMDKIHGFGNAWLMRNYGDIDVYESDNTGEPFALYWLNSGNWYLVTEDEDEHEIFARVGEKEPAKIISVTVNPGDWMEDERSFEIQVEEGMTWREWVDSDYNTNIYEADGHSFKAVADDDTVLLIDENGNEQFYITLEFGLIFPDDTIDPEVPYEFHWWV